jgi:hypothetical protein
LPPDPPSATYPVGLTFLLPHTILTAPGPAPYKLLTGITDPQRMKLL